MKLTSQLLDLVFPPKCPFCQKILDAPRAVLCPSCQKVLPWLAQERSGRKVEFTDGCYSPLAYRDSVPEAIHRYKFSRVRAYAQPFGRLMAQCALDHELGRAELVTWAPLSAKRLRQRGFDQAQLLAQTVGEELGLPVCATLRKTTHTKPQSGLDSDDQRALNARGAYCLAPDGEVTGKSLILVDDVVTSGATLRECANVLRQGGAEQIWCLTLAKAGEG